MKFKIFHKHTIGEWKFSRTIKLKELTLTEMRKTQKIVLQKMLKPTSIVCEKWEIIKLYENIEKAILEKNLPKISRTGKLL